MCRCVGGVIVGVEVCVVIPLLILCNCIGCLIYMVLIYRVTKEFFRELKSEEWTKPGSLPPTPCKKLTSSSQESGQLSSPIVTVVQSALSRMTTYPVTTMASLSELPEESIKEEAVTYDRKPFGFRNIWISGRLNVPGVIPLYISPLGRCFYFNELLSQLKT